MKKTTIVGLCCALLLTSASVGGIYVKDLKAIEAQEVSIHDSKNKLSEFYDSKKEFFEKPWEDVHKEVNQLLTELDTKREFNQNYNGWADSTSINKDLRLLEKEINKTLDKIKVYSILENIFGKDLNLSVKNEKEMVDYSKEKELEKIDVEALEDNTFDNHVKFYTDLAREQFSEFKKAEDKLKVVYDKEKVKSTDKKGIAEAKKAITVLNDSENKEQLSQKLSLVEKKLKEEEEEAKKKKAEQERIAKEKAEKERKEKEARELLEREQYVAENNNNQQASSNNNSNSNNSNTNNNYNNNSNNNSNNQATKPAPKPAPAPVKPQVPSWGVHIKGTTAPIGYYSVDGGAVPLYTQEAYLWTADYAPNNYYLIDYSNSLGLGLKVLGLSVGETVYINGEPFTVAGSHVVQSGAYSDTIPQGYRAYFQTCMTPSSTSDMLIVMLN